MIRFSHAGCALLAALICMTPVSGVTFDLDSAQNGQKISGMELSPLVSISSGGPNLGATIFDTDPTGPNMNADDQDLLVDIGNILILQTVNRPEDFGGSDFFELPDDEPNGGSITFDYAQPVSILSIDLVDIDVSTAVEVLLTDTAGLTRTYSVPSDWTGEIPGAPGVGTLDLTILSDQVGFASTATAMQDLGFSASSVAQMSVMLAGSGGITNIVSIPEPASLSMFVLGAVALAFGRRR